MHFKVVKTRKMSRRGVTESLDDIPCENELHGLSLSRLGLNIQADGDGNSDGSSSRSDSPVLNVFTPNRDASRMDTECDKPGVDTEDEDEATRTQQTTRCASGRPGSSEDPLWDTDDEANDTPPTKKATPTKIEDPQRQGFRQPIPKVVKKLTTIARRFIDPEEILDGVDDPSLDWMLDGLSPSRYATILMEMIHEIRLLAVKSTLSADSMKQNGTVRENLSTIVARISRIAKANNKLRRPGGGRNLNPMNKVEEELTRLRKLVRTYATLPEDDTKILELLQQQLRELSSEIETYIDEKMQHEAIPDWLIEIRMRGQSTPQEKIDKAVWDAKKSQRIHQAKEEAIRTYTSIIELRAEVERARRRVNPKADEDVEQSAKRARIQQVFEIGFDDEYEPEDVGCGEYVPEEIIYESDFELDSDSETSQSVR